MNDLYAHMMTDNMNIALYSTSTKIESVEMLTIISIDWGTCEINSCKIMFRARHLMAKHLEFRERYITSTMVSVDMCEILYVLWEQDNKVGIFANCMSR